VPLTTGVTVSAQVLSLSGGSVSLTVVDVFGGVTARPPANSQLGAPFTAAVFTRAETLDPGASVMVGVARPG
jgi:hypothetical protein